MGKIPRRPLGMWKDLVGTQDLRTVRKMTLEAGSRALVLLTPSIFANVGTAQNELAGPVEIWQKAQRSAFF